MPTFRAVQTGTINNTTNFTVTVPATAQVGDLLILHGTWRNASSSAQISLGWSLLTYQTNPNGASPVGVAVYTRVCETGDAGNTFTIITSSVVFSGCWEVLAYSNASPFVTFTTQIDASPTVNVTAPSITATTGDVVLSFYGIKSTGGGPFSTVPATTRTNMTGPFSDGVGMASSDITAGSSGATSPQTAVGFGTTPSTLGMTLDIVPALNNPVAIRSYTTSSVSGAGPLSITKPTGTVANDIIVIWCMAGGAIACTGFTALSTALVTHETLLWRVADGSEGASFSLTGQVTTCAAVCVTLTNSSGTVWDPNTPAAASSTSASNSVPSFLGLENSASKATLNNGDMLLWYFALSTVQGSIIPTTLPAGFTPIWSFQSNNAEAVLAWKTQVSAGTTGTLAGSINGSSPIWAGSALAIRSLNSSNLNGTAGFALGPLTLNATGTVFATLNGTSTVALGPLTLTVTGIPIVAAQIHLGPLSLTATGNATGYAGPVTTVTVADRLLNTATLQDKI